MSIRIHISGHPLLKASLKRSLMDVIQKTIKRANKRIPVKSLIIDVGVFPENTVRDIGGIGGYTPDAHHMEISLNPSLPTFSRKWRTALAGTITHEWHHVARWRKPGYGKTLGEALITEGLADHFVREIFPNMKPFPWTNALTSTKKRLLLNRAKRSFNHSYHHDAWFFGSKEKQIPPWTGYTLGYELVKKYLQRHPSQSPSSLVHVTAKRILTTD